MESWDEGDAALSADIFGTPHRDQALASVRAWLAEQGYDDAEIVVFELSVGAAIGVRLADGSNLFAKIWPQSADRAALAAQIHVQDKMARRGFPAARARSAVLPFGEGSAVLMEFVRPGAPTDVRIPGVTEAMAEGLARLVKESSDLIATPHLPRHVLPTMLWPKPHNALFNFDVTNAGAEWIDACARRALELLRAKPGSPVPGHLDWSAKNMRMRDRTIAVVYDWDSVFVADEMFVVGSAAASFPTTWELPVPAIPTPEQTAAFVSAYESARGIPFDRYARERIHAAATYNQCYIARCDHSVDPEGARHRWTSVLGRLSG